MNSKALSLVLVTALALAGNLFAKDTGTPAEERPIDLVICLDTSGSMQGLIEASKQKLWDIVNELGKAKPKPHLRVGLYVYGTPSYGAETGYVRKLVDLTDDLDTVYAKLTPLRTDGGDEFVARVVRAATLEQPWSNDRDALKIIVVSGNEPATQDQTYRVEDVCKAAITKGIIVDTIYCGSPSNSEAGGWREVARLADGQFASIDQNNGTVVVSTPFDQKLADLSTAINKTYVGYGREAEGGYARQAAADASSFAAAPAVAASRAAAKASVNYRNSAWDLVDARKEKDFRLDQVKKEELPAEMQKMSTDEQKAFLETKAGEREKLQKDIAALNVDREKFIAAEMKKPGNTTDKAFDAAMLKAIREQVAKKNFVFGE